MKTLLTTTAALLLMSTAAMATSGNRACPVSTDTSGVQIIQKGCSAFAGTTGAPGTQGAQGVTGAQGPQGEQGVQGEQGLSGKDGNDGRDAVAPLGALSFAAATSSFYGDGIGFGLSDSNYGDLEGSIVLGKYLGNDWRVVVGITTDFNTRHAASIGLGLTF